MKDGSALPAISGAITTKLVIIAVAISLSNGLSSFKSLTLLSVISIYGFSILASSVSGLVMKRGDR